MSNLDTVNFICLRQPEQAISTCSGAVQLQNHRQGRFLFEV